MAGRRRPLVVSKSNPKNRRPQGATAWSIGPEIHKRPLAAERQPPRNSLPSISSAVNIPPTTQDEQCQRHTNAVGARDLQSADCHYFRHFECRLLAHPTPLMPSCPVSSKTLDPVGKSGAKGPNQSPRRRRLEVALGSCSYTVRLIVRRSTLEYPDPHPSCRAGVSPMRPSLATKGFGALSSLSVKILPAGASLWVEVVLDPSV